MQIKGSGVSPVNDPQMAEQAAKAQKQNERGESFLEMLRAGAEQKPAAHAQGGHMGAATVERVEAVAARARIQLDLSADVSDFLELIAEKPYLLAGVDLEALPPDETSTGGGALTEDQAAELRAKYEVSHLGPAGQWALFRELTELGVLSGADARGATRTVAPEVGTPVDYLTGEPGFRDVETVPETDPRGRLSAMIHNERFAYQHVLLRYGQHCGAVAQLADSHQRVLDILKQI